MLSVLCILGTDAVMDPILNQGMSGRPEVTLKILPDGVDATASLSFDSFKLRHVEKGIVNNSDHPTSLLPSPRKSIGS